MKKIEQRMLEAIQNKQTKTLSNTVVTYDPVTNVSSVFLFGNLLGDFIHQTGEFKVCVSTLRAWPTSTTRSRINALGFNYYICRDTFYINGEELV